MYAMAEDEFWELVEAELDSIPDELARGLDNVAFFVEDRPEDGSLDMLGVYEGFDQGERADYGFGELPDRIVIFREPTLAICESVEEVRKEIRVTLVHEIAHFYGVDEARIHELGWG